MGLLLQKILRITHAGSHKYDKVQDMYKRKVILCGGNGSNKKFSVKVPRLGPPRSILEPVMRQIEAKLGVQSTDRGKWARGLPTVRLSSRRHSSRRPRLHLREDPGNGGMPPLAEFEGGKTRFPMVFSFNAIGFGNSQLTTVALRNPYKRATAAHLRILGIGSLSDNPRAC